MVILKRSIGERVLDRLEVVHLEGSNTAVLQGLTTATSLSAAEWERLSEAAHAWSLGLPARFCETCREVAPHDDTRCLLCDGDCCDGDRLCAWHADDRRLAAEERMVDYLEDIGR